MRNISPKSLTESSNYFAAENRLRDLAQPAPAPTAAVLPAMPAPVGQKALVRDKPRAQSTLELLARGQLAMQRLAAAVAMPPPMTSAQKMAVRDELAGMLRQPRLDEHAFKSKLVLLDSEELDKPDSSGFKLALTAMINGQTKAMQWLAERGVDGRNANS